MRDWHFAPGRYTTRPAVGRITRISWECCPKTTQCRRDSPTSTRFHGMLMRPQPHPEEARRAVSKGGTHYRCRPSFETPRCARLLRMRLSVTQHSMKAGTRGIWIPLGRGLMGRPSGQTPRSSNETYRPGDDTRKVGYTL